MRNFYGFEYRSGLKTTEGSPNKKTGRMSIAGDLYIFKSKSERDDWIERGKITSDMRSNCRTSIFRCEIRSLHLGMSMYDFNEYLIQGLRE